MTLSGRLSRVANRLRPRSDPQPCLPCGQSSELRPFAPGPRGIDLLTDDVVPRLHPGLLYTAVEGSVVLYDPGRSRSHILNPAAATVWAEIDGNRPLGSLLDTLVQRSEPGRAAIERHVKVILDQLIQGGVATIDPISDTPAEDTNTEADTVGWAEPHPPDLDGIDWSASAGPVDVLGAAVTVRTNVTELAPPLRDAVSGFTATPPYEPGTDHGSTSTDARAAVVLSVLETQDEGASRYRLYVNGRRRWSDDVPDQALAAVEVELTQIALDQGAGRVLLHAGAVERAGQVVAIAGDSGRGKSTLTAALALRGCRYLTDEITALDPRSLEAEPYPKALDLDERAHRLLGLTPPAPVGVGLKTPVAVQRLGEVSPGGHLALIVLLTDETLDQDDDLPTGPIRDLVDILRVTFATSLAVPDALDHLAGVITRTPILRLGRAPIHELVDQVEAALQPV